MLPIRPHLERSSIDFPFYCIFFKWLCEGCILCVQACDYACLSVSVSVGGGGRGTNYLQ